MTTKRKFKFAVGLMQDRTVTVVAEDYEWAVVAASGELDQRARRAGKEAPVAWTLTLLEEKELEKK